MIKRAFILVLFVQLTTSLSGQTSDPNRQYVDQLKAISERIQKGYDDDDWEMTAQGYYDRAKHNFSLHLKDQDVIDDLVSCARIYRHIKDDMGYYRARMALAEFYINQEIYLDDAIKLTEEALDYYTDNGRSRERTMAVSQLGHAYQRKLDYAEATKYVEQGLKASIELKDVSMELSNRILITRLLGNLGNVEKVIQQGEFIIKKERDLGINQESAEANFLIGSNLLMDDQIYKAIPYLKSATQLNNNVNDLAQQSNSLLSKAYIAVDSVSAAYRHLERANQITTELYDQNKFVLANKTAIQFQSTEKDKEIRELEEDNKQYAFKLTQRTRLFLIVSVLIGLAAFMAYNYFRLQRQRLKMEAMLSHQKEEIAQQKLNELENSVKIENLQAMVFGQEAERTRIAEDLHDSLGGTLSTLKLQYDALQLDHEDLTVDTEYQKIMSMIDGACTEVRDIARNLKPISLEKLGLTAALRDLVNRYAIRGVLEISLHTHDVDGILGKEDKLHVYRIIQELLNNALKHAKASEIDVQVNKRDASLIIMVEDNGHGFDQATVKQGLGLGNLQSRVNVLKGEMEIDTSPDRGTSVTVYIPIRSAQMISHPKMIENISH